MISDGNVVTQEIKILIGWVMKNTSVFKTDLRDLFTPVDMDRREFIKAGVNLAVVATGLELITGCVATETPRRRIIPAKGKFSYKVRPSQEGCFVGFYKDQNKKFRIGKQISATINHYGNNLGAKPAIIAFWTFLDLGFPSEEAETMKKNGIIPYVSIMPGHEKWHRSYSPNDIVRGRCDWYIKKLAESALALGEKHGGFFLTTMVEFNASWWIWSQKPDTTPAWKHMWEIFEEEGANQYATWVWEAFSPVKYLKYVTEPEPYYPGDKYVDWIGINIFANLKNPLISQTTMFGELMSQTYEQMRRNHPQKPLMVSEFGRTPGPNQPSWLADAFRSMKDDFSSIKAAIYYDNITAVFSGQDHTLDQTSLNTLKEVFKDSYWLMTKKGS
jgi:Glycosyl hydrolase family 26